MYTTKLCFLREMTLKLLQLEKALNKMKKFSHQKQNDLLYHFLKNCWKKISNFVKFP